uniref:Uncharacterized protein n=1 Tax=Sphaerodactylus townsendi TaxID=933632 RepID=A0ACB8ESY6_9SAUR
MNEIRTHSQTVLAPKTQSLCQSFGNEAQKQEFIYVIVSKLKYKIFLFTFEGVGKVVHRPQDYTNPIYYYFMA